MKQSSPFIRFSLTLLLLTLWVSGCGDSAENDDDIGSDGDDSECTTDADCASSDSNFTCSRTQNQCIDHGLCEDDASCVLWYGDGAVCLENGICTGGSSDDDDDDTSDDDDDTSDDDDDVVTGCPNLTGHYTGDFTNCETSGEMDVWAYVSDDCTITFIFEGGQIGGSIDSDGNINTTSGLDCDGSGSVGNNISLTCGDCTIELEPEGNGGGDGDIKIQPPTLDFGAVEIGTQTNKTAVISNLGDGALNILQITFAEGTHQDFSIYNPEEWDLPVSLTSGFEKDLKVLLDAQNEGDRVGTLLVISDDPDTPIIHIPLDSQQKAIPKIELEPDVLYFGSLPLGDSEPSYFLIKSIGGATAQVVDIKITDDADGAYTLDLNEDNTPPFALETPYTMAVGVTYTTIEGVHNVGVRVSGYAEVTYLGKNETEETIRIDLNGDVHDRQPQCIDIQPLDGIQGVWGMGTTPGPGIRWGSAQVGAPNTRAASFRNCGDETLTIYGFTWQNPFFDAPPMEARAFYESPPGAFGFYQLGRNETVFVDMVFVPRTEGIFYASAFFVNSDAQSVAFEPQPFCNTSQGTPGICSNAATTECTTNGDCLGAIKMGLAGQGAARALSVLPPKIDFGLITLGCCSRPEEITVWNIGDLTLTIATVEIGLDSADRCGQPDEDCAFETRDVPSMPYYLGGEDPNNTPYPQNFTFRVKFCPVRMGLHEGRVEILSDDANAAQFIVPLKGEGTNISHQRDEFHQITHPMVDILWVVDCSGSMGAEQSNLARNFGTFINEATSWNADLQIAITTCDTEDPAHSGHFQGSPKVLKNRGPGALSDSEMISKFEDNIDVGTSCSGTERGLDAAQTALSPPLLTQDPNNPGENDEFLREDAKLAIIWVSDEPDQSVGELAFYVDFFRTIKGARNVNMLETYAIVGDKPNGCEDPSTGEASSGAEYIYVADNCNPHPDAHFESICSSDYRPIYRNLADNLFALRSQFFLTRLAEEDSITVWVNGVETEDYEYDEESNSIIFDENDPPPPGATIVAEYDTLCLH